MSKNIKDVQQFWESNPLWTGESQFESGTKDFFEEHRRVVAEDCFAGKIDNRIMPHKRNWERILDLGCGPGLWTVEISQNGCKGKITAADLTINALALAKERCRLYGVEVFCSQQNAEKLAFRSAVFSHVNC
jgi:2-polyprenyl-3-methyl-5-hydroxy-6-metoxy-1,4-benzoquinol methylase